MRAPMRQEMITVIATQSGQIIKIVSKHGSVNPNEPNPTLKTINQLLFDYWNPCSADVLADDTVFYLFSRSAE